MNRSGQGLLDNTLTGFLWSSLAASGQTVLNALSVFILARLLTPAEFGVVGAAMVVIGFAQIFTNLGVGPALVHLPVVTTTHMRVGFTISLAFGLLVATLIAMAGGPIARFFQMPQLIQVVPALSSMFVFSGAASVGYALLQRALRFRHLAITELWSFVLGYGLVAVILAYLNFGVWALVVGHIVQAIVRTTFILMIERGHIGISWSRQAASELWTFGFGYSIARVANYFATQGDNLIVGRFLGPVSLGLYSRAYQLMMLPTNLIGTVLERVMFPALAIIQGDSVRLGRAVAGAIGGITMLTMPISAVLYIASPELVLVALGPSWEEVARPFRVLVIALVFRTAYKISDSLAKATGAVYRRALRQWIYAIAVVSGAIAGQYLGGLQGVAIGVVGAVILNYGLMLQLANTIVKVPIRNVALGTCRHAAIAVVTGAVAMGVRGFALHVAWHPLAALFATLMIPALVWLAAWMWLPRIFGAEGKASRSHAARLAVVIRNRISR